MGRVYVFLPDMKFPTHSDCDCSGGRECVLEAESALCDIVAMVDKESHVIAQQWEGEKRRKGKGETHNSMRKRRRSS